MEKSMSVFKRLLAMLLVFALVVGYVPAGVFAEENANTAAPEVTSLSAELKRAATEVSEPTEAETTAPVDGGDETTDPTGEGDESLEARNRVRSSASAPSDPTETPSDEPVYVYTYTVVVKVDNTELDADQYSVKWYADVNGEKTELTEPEDDITPNILENVAYETVTAEVTYGDVKLTMNNAKGEGDSINVSASIGSWNSDVVVGVPFAIPTGNLVSNVEGLTYNVTVSGSAQDNGNGQAYATAAGMGIATITETWSANGVVYAANTYSVNASVRYPAATLSVKDEAKDWYSEEQMVVVNVNNTLGLVSSEYLPAVTVGTVTYSKWAAVEGGWTMEVSVPSTTTVTYAAGTSAEVSLEVKIDADEPAFGDVSYAYDEGELTFVYFTYRVGTSGLESITINETPVEVNEYNLYAIQKSDSVKVEVTSKAGKTKTLEITNIQPDLNAVITYPELDNGEGGTLDGTTYYVSAGKSIMLQVENADDNIYNIASATTVKDANGNELTLSEAGWTYTDGKWIAYIPITDTVNGVELHFVDEQGRGVDKTGDRTYIVDTGKPEITIDPVTVTTDTGSIQYVDDAFSYVIRVKDVNLAENNGSIQLSFNKNGNVHNYSLYDFTYANGEYTYAIPMKHGDTLTNVSVTANDNTSNSASVADLGDAAIVVDTEAPTIKAWLSANVTHLYENRNGKFAVIDEAVGKDVTVYVRITDDNLDETAVNEFMTREGWSKNDDGDWTKTLTVEDHQTGTMNFTFMAKDMNGRYHSDVVALTLTQTDSRAVVNNLNLEPQTAEDGSVSYTVDLNLDRRAPGNGSDETAAPEITLAVKSGVYVMAEVSGQSIEIYNGAPVFQLTVFDTSTQGYDSGLQKVRWTLSDTGSFVNEELSSGEKTFEDGEFNLSIDIPVTVNGEGESDGAKLQIFVYDHAGNVTSYTKFFGVDNQKPVVDPDLIFDDGETEFTGSIYDHTRSTKFTIRDLNLATYKVTINGVEQTGTPNEEKTAVEYNLAFNKDSEYYVTITAADKNGNSYENNYTFTVDTTDPVVIVKKDTSANVTSTETGVDYHDGIVTYYVTVEDTNLDHGTVVVNIYYQDAPSEAIEVVMSGGDEDGPDVYTGSFEIVDNGKVLTGISIDVVDDAGRRPSEIVVIEDENGLTKGDENGFTQGEDGIWNYSGNAVVVDMTAPEIHVEKATAEAGYVQTYDDHDYYNSNVTYTITVKDMYLEDHQGIVAYVLYQGKDAAEPVDMILKDQVSTELLNDEDICEGSFEVTDGKLVENIVIEVVDSTGLTVNEEHNNLAVTDTDNLTSFEFNSDTQNWRYIGNHVVVDTTDPVASMTFSDNVHSFYRNSDTIYFVLATPFTAESGAEFDPVTAETQEVTVTLTVTDNNLALDNATNVKSMKANEELSYGWVGSTAVNSSSTVTYTATSGKIGPDGIVAFRLDVNMMDLAGRIPAAFESETKTREDFLYVEPDADGHVAFNFVLDYERPSSGKNDSNAPVISVEPVLPESIVRTKTASGLDLFNGAFTFDLYVSDGHQDDNINSGLKYVRWEIVDNAEIPYVNSSSAVYGSYGDTENVALPENGNFTIEVNVPETNGESNEVVLKIWAEDNVGNLMTYEKTFGVDTLAPRFDITYDNDDAENGYYYKAPRTATVKVIDLNLDVNNYSIQLKSGDGLKEFVDPSKKPDEGRNDTYTYEVTCEQDGEYWLDVKASDLTSADATHPTDYFIIDRTDPEITVEKTTGNHVSTAEGADFYNGEVTYTVTVTDQYLDANAGTAQLVISYLDGTDSVINIAEAIMMAAEGDEEETSPSDWDTYAVSFTVTDGVVVTGITLQVVDNAGNIVNADQSNLTVVDSEGLTEFAYADGIWTYTGNMIVVDMQSPEITVEKTSDTFVQTYNDVDYYNGEVTYTVTVTDAFLNLTSDAAVVEMTVVYQDGTEGPITLELESTDNSLITDADIYTGSLTVTDGKRVDNIIIDVVDNAGNNKSTLNVEDENEKTTFEYDEETGLWNYSANQVVVDTTAPKVTMWFDNNVVDSVFYSSAKNTIFVTLKEVTEGNSGEILAHDPQNVVVTVQVEDLNLTLDAENSNSVTGNYAWSGETPVNEPSTVKLTAESGYINTDGTYVFLIDVSVLDLAGNVPVDFNTVATDTGAYHSVDVDEKGHFAYNISVDRLRPSSGKADAVAPTIEVTTDNSVAVYTSTNDLELYSAPFHFNMTVTDGADNEFNAGVDFVSWTISDEDNNVVNEYTTELDVDGDGTYQIPVTLAQGVAQGETNSVVLNVTAIDKVGNIMHFQKKFAFDNLAPRVTITQSNHSAQNGFYFNQDQIITVEINDLNFEPTTSSVTTEVAFNGWQSAGNNVYRTVLTYNVDGDYTFEMATTDRANNQATIDYTTGLVALQSFTIDKTAPIINVTYNPAVPVDTDGNAVQYFDTLRTVTVTITEHNFRASDVNADLGPANGLGYWASNGDYHTASDTFNEGNGYNVSVAYTDLAGNPAVVYDSPTFSIDLTAPTITMTKGDIQNGQPIAGDLVLGFTINDAQDNLKDFSVEVMFLNSSFQLQKVEGAEFYTVTDGDRTNGYVDFTNIAAEKQNDGIYTVRITALDYAGHVVNLTPDLVFSLNRFGSTFTVADTYTEDFLTADATGIVYRKEVSSDLVIKEINPNQVWQDAEHAVEGSAITISVNGNAINLKNGVDYDVVVTEMGTGAEKWYEYIYNIKSSVFHENSELVDGEYAIFFYSEDNAGNKNTNEANEGSVLLLGSDGTYSGKISFTLDHKAPVVTILGIQEGDKLFKANRSVEINVSDNTPVSIAVYINDELVEFIETADGQPITSDWIYFDTNTGSYMMNMSEKDVRQNVRVVVTDAAGNEIVTEVNNVMLTENLWYQYINSLPAILTSVVALVGLTTLIIVLLKKRKKNPNEEAAKV